MKADLPLPPFGKIIQIYQQSTIKLSIPIYLFVGNKAFEEAKLNASLFSPTLCLIPGKYFHEFKWPVFNQKIILCDTGGMSEDELQLLCLNLLDSSAEQVTIFSPNFPIQIYNHSSK